MKKTLKVSAIAFAFLCSFAGVTYSVKTKTIGGNKISETLFSLGTQAQAYCNEQSQTGDPPNDGWCSGTVDKPESRCFYSDQHNCDGAQQLPPG